MNAGWKSPHLAEPAHVAGPAHLIWTAPISFQTKVEYVDLWLAITKSYFKNENFEVYAENK